jgi:hypothetical protein
LVGIIWFVLVFDVAGSVGCWFACCESFPLMEMGA